MVTSFIGIDISKHVFDASVEVRGKVRHRQFSNSQVGFEALLRWCEEFQLGDMHFCMEATGAHWMRLSTFLHEQDRKVSVVNAACIKRFAQSELRRTKTDKVDAGIIARFCKAMSPELWQPLSDEVRTLQQLVRRLHDLTKMRQQERNRRSSESLEGYALQSVERMLKQIDEEIERLRKRIERLYKMAPILRDKRDLLLTIPGVGPETANAVLSEIPCLDLFQNAKQVVAFAGLAPKEITSGSSVRGRTRMSKMGRSYLRQALYMPSITARTYNPVIHAFCERLSANGKAPMKIVGAAMRKLLHIIFGVLKSEKPFSVKLAGY